MTVEKRKANRGPYDYIPRARHFSPSNSLGTFPNPFGKPIFEKEQKSPPLSNPFLLNKSSDPFSDTSASRNCNVNPSNVWPPVLSSVPGRETRSTSPIDEPTEVEARRITVENDALLYLCFFLRGAGRTD